MKKYILLKDKTKIVNGHVLHRIQAIRDFGDVYAGALGGWVEKEDNLSHDDKCWVFGDAMVYGNAKVHQNAMIYNNVEVYDNAIVCGNARVINDVKIFESALVCERARLMDDAQIYGASEVLSHAYVRENAKVHGKVTVDGISVIRGDADVSGEQLIYVNEEITGDAIIKNKSDYIVFKNWWSSGRYFVWTRSNNMWKVGCFYGTGDELIKKAYIDSEISGREYKRVVNYVNSIILEDKFK